MKKQFLLFGLLILLFTACKKQSFNATKQSVIDDEKIQAYIAANHINVTKAPSGIYYEIIRADTGTHPLDTATVQVSYTGKLLNGTVFDTESADIIGLSGAIVGWQDGLPLIAPGGRIRLIIPSALGYGSSVSGSIPANSVLDFTIDLLGYYN
jgi:FKBP-type peptidyl-prolyl cis-trans isomerase